MNVKTLIEHSNSFGAAYTKQPGDEYACDADTAAALARDGLAELVDQPEGTDDAVQVRGRQGAGSGAE